MYAAKIGTILRRMGIRYPSSNVTIAGGEEDIMKAGTQIAVTAGEALTAAAASLLGITYGSSSSTYTGPPPPRFPNTPEGLETMDRWLSGEIVLSNGLNVAQFIERQGQFHLESLSRLRTLYADVSKPKNLKDTFKRGTLGKKRKLYKSLLEGNRINSQPSIDDRLQEKTPAEIEMEKFKVESLEPIEGKLPQEPIEGKLPQEPIEGKLPQEPIIDDNKINAR